MEKYLLLTRYDHVRAAARRHAEDRGRARDPVDPAARHHPGEPGRAEGLERRRAGDAQQSRSVPGQGLSRSGPAPARRGARRHDPRARRRDCSACCSEGGPREPASASSRPRIRPRWRANGCRSCWRTSASLVGRSDLVAILREEILAVLAGTSPSIGTMSRSASIAASMSRPSRSTSRSRTRAAGCARWYDAKPRSH